MAVSPTQGPSPSSAPARQVFDAPQSSPVAAPAFQLIDSLQGWLGAEAWGNEHGRRLGQSLLLLADPNPVVVGLALSKLAQDLSFSVDIVGVGSRVFFGTPVTFEQVTNGVLAVADASGYLFVKRQAMTVAMILDPDRTTVKALAILEDQSQPSELRVAALEVLDANRVRTTVDSAVVAAMDDADVAVRSMAIQVASRFMFAQEGVFDKVIDMALSEEGLSQEMALGCLVETIQSLQSDDARWNTVVPIVLTKLEPVLMAPNRDMSENGSGSRALNLATLLRHPDTAALLERLLLQSIVDAKVDINSPYFTTLIYMEDLAIPAIVRLIEQDKLHALDSLSALLNVLRVGSGTGEWRAIAALMKHNSEAVRVAAQGAIFNRAGDFRAITAMLPYLDDPDVNIREFAREIFSSALHSSQRFPIEVNRLCQMLGSDEKIGDKTEAELAARALRLWGIAALPHMQTNSDSGTISDVARARLQTLIAEITAVGLSEVSETLRAGGELSPWVASALAFSAFEKLSAPQLVDVLVNGDSVASARAATILKQMGPHALSVLLEHAQHLRVRGVVDSMGAAAIRATGAWERGDGVRLGREERGPWGSDTDALLKKLTRK